MGTALGIFAIIVGIIVTLIALGLLVETA